MSVSRLFDFAHLALQKNPSESALVTKYNGVWTKTSSQELVNKGNKISRGLLKLGIKPGDKIAIISTNNRTKIKTSGAVLTVLIPPIHVRALL